MPPRVWVVIAILIVVCGFLARRKESALSVRVLAVSGGDLRLPIWVAAGSVRVAVFRAFP
jgi:hypothetical protein